MRCRGCGKTWTVSDLPEKGFYLKELQMEKLRDAYRRGLSIREGAKLAGVSQGTAHKYYKLRRREIGPASCACGQIAGHRGWCRLGLLRLRGE